MQHAFWGLFGLCVAMTVYPYILYPLVLRMLPAKPVMSESVVSDRGREFALLFCAYNEAKALPEKISNLRQLHAAYPDLEFLAFDDCSSDGTAELLEASGVPIHVVRGAGRNGKAHGMKLLAGLTDREFLIFTDANVELAPESIDHLRSAYSDATVGGVCGLLEYTDPEGTPIAHVGGWYWRLEEMVKSLESRTGNVMGADGSIFSTRRSLYPKFPDSVLDDLTVSMAVIFKGYRLIKHPSVRAHERLVTSRHDDYRRRIRISTRAFHTHLWLRPQLRNLSIGDRWRYYSHRYLRWNGAFFMIVGFVSAISALMISSEWVLGAGILAAVAAGGVGGLYLRLRPISGLVHMISSIFLTWVGVLRARQGHTMTTWKPPAR